jgi:acyl-CoA synthetase (AMP-forming)/AMP-acid ligase II
MVAAYGLAENTASVTNCGRGTVRLDKARLEQGQVVVVDADARDETVGCANCGRSSKDGDVIRIVDPETLRPCAPDQTGEIWVRSATTAAGYYGRPALSREVFRATVAGEEEGPGYLRTGDIGFMLDGELFVSGRRKDLIVVRGRNIHPADVEDSVRASHELVRPGGVAVFGFEPAGDPAAAALDGEWLGVFAEIARDRPDDVLLGQIADAVRSAVYRDHRLPVRLLVLGRPGLVRKTTSGKVRRAACRRALLDGTAEREPGTIRVLRFAPEPGTQADELTGAVR